MEQSSSIGKISRTLGISRETVILYTTRIIEAILSIKDDFIKWPGRRRRKVTRDYFQRYSMNVQLICNEREIIYYQVGYPGSCPDTECFRNCDIFKNASRYFTNGEYILADGGYLL